MTDRSALKALLALNVCFGTILKMQPNEKCYKNFKFIILEDEVHLLKPI